MSSPLRNTVRSFWTPEVNRDPGWLRIVRLDKAALLLIATGVALTITGFGIVAAAIVGMLS